MSWPNFFIVGANKAGTTALASCISQHPDVFMSPVKEPMFFVCDGTKPQTRGPLGRFMSGAVYDSVDYQRLFVQGSGCRALGEASTAYLHRHELAATRIRGCLPKARLIAILRHPADRAFSNYLFFRQHGVEKRRSFHAVLHDDLARIKRCKRPEHWYLELGFYYRALSSYYRLFDANQIRVFLYETWRDEPERVLRDIFEFLNVDPTFRPVVAQELNVSFVPRIGVADWFLKGKVRDRLKRLPLGNVGKQVTSRIEQWIRVKPTLAADDRKVMVDFFRDDILKLQDLIDKDLSNWLTA